MQKKTKEQNSAAVLAALMITMTIIVGFVAIILKQTDQNTQTAMTNATAQAEAQLAEQNASMVVNAEPLPQLLTFSKPNQMLAVTLEPGVDFITQLSVPLKSAKAAAVTANEKNSVDALTKDSETLETLETLELDEEKSKLEIDEVLDEVQEMGMNTVFVQTNTVLGTVHVVDSIRSLSSFDAMDYILKQAHDRGLFVYALYDISLLPDGSSIEQARGVTVKNIDKAVKPLREFAHNYRVDGILLEGCRNPFTETSYADYSQNGAGVGLEPYMINETKALVYGAADAVRQVDQNIQVGLAADAVWATSTQAADGLSVETETSSLKSDNTDTRALVKSGKLDFMVVKNTTATKDPLQPFGTVLEWWDNLSGEVGIPCYMLHAANKAGTWQDGWGGRSELSSQLSLTLESPNVQGSVFQSMNNLKKNPNGTTTALKTLIEEEVIPEKKTSNIIFADTEEPQSGVTASKEDQISASAEKTEKTEKAEKVEDKQNTSTNSTKTNEETKETKMTQEPAKTENKESEKTEPEKAETKKPETETKENKEVSKQVSEQVSEEDKTVSLQFKNPTKSSLTTKSSTYTFQGVSDPNSDLMLNGKKITTNSNGSFKYEADISPGENTFTFIQADKQSQFTINRQVQLLEDISPVGTISVDGESLVEISAMAYKDADVVATVNGQDLSLTPVIANETAEDEYRKYVGVYTAPTAAPDTQSLGSVVVKASYQSNTESLTGAKVSVNQKIVLPKPSGSTSNTSNVENIDSIDEDTDNTPISNGKLVKVVTEQALTFPVGKATIYPDQTCYPLPNGTMDYVVGDKISIKDGNSYRTYYNLGSGRRVYSTEVKVVSSGGKLEGNAITGMTVKANADYTYVILKSKKPVPFLPNYTGSQFTIDFKYTTSTSDDMDLNKNPLFSSASWVGSKLNLAFITQGGFLGYKAYNENGNIVFRFNNPTSISGARIVVDPGHGGGDPGAATYINPPEKTINWGLAQEIAAKLEEKGANVLLLQTHDKGMSMDERLVKARNFNAQIFLSVHTNTSENNSNAVGSEAYYFYPFSRGLASTVATAISSGLDTNNRGAKYDVFYLTRDPQFVGILSESGFLTNKREYQKMQDSAYKNSIAKNVASSIAAFLEDTGASNAGVTGTQSVGVASDASSGPSSSSTTNQEAESESEDVGNTSSSGSGQSVSKGNGIVKYVILSTKEMTLSKGQEKELGVTLKGDTTAKKNFASSNTKVATVDENGIITAKSAGKADISIIAGNQKGVCKVTVTNTTYVNPTPEVKGTEADTGVYTPVELVKITPRIVSVAVGESSKVKVRFTPENASNKDVTWDVSGGEKYVEITQSGVVTGIKPGVASIVVISEDSYVRDEITVEVFD